MGMGYAMTRLEAAFIVLVLGAGVIGYAAAQTTPDPCRAVRAELNNYAVIVANLQVALREAQTPKEKDSGGPKHP